MITEPGCRMLFQLKVPIFPAAFLIAVTVIFSSCKSTPDPSATITLKINGNAVAFTVEALDAESFSWDFGDGSAGSEEQNPVHIFAEFGKEYTVNLTVQGPGGTVIVTTTVSIPSMTSMEMLTGGENDLDGRAWKISQDADIFFAKPDTALTIKKTFAKGILSSWGFSTAYQDKYVFKYDGSFSVIPAGQGMPAGLMYCIAKNIPNAPPSQAASEKGLTLMTPYQASPGFSFAMNESKNLELQLYNNDDDESENVTNVTLPDVMTLTFSKEAFIGFKDWHNECVILELTENSLKAAVFISTAPADNSLRGKVTGVFIFTLVPA